LLINEITGENMTISKQTIKKLYIHNQDAFCEVYNEYRPAVYYVIQSIVMDAETAKELVQDTFIKMWNNIYQFDYNTNFTAWLLSIAKNTAKDFLRKKVPLEYIDENQLECPMKKTVLNEFTIDAAGILNEVEYEVLFLSIIYNFKRKEVAEILDKPLGTILRLYKQGLDKLRDFYQTESKTTTNKEKEKNK
jgi:RNA polymerase sigma-70 factor (ECF subfamily)